MLANTRVCVQAFTFATGACGRVTVTLARCLASIIQHDPSASATHALQTLTAMLQGYNAVIIDDEPVFWCLEFFSPV